MELNWTTFILEIINFLILVWLLKRFFYQPIRTIVARRQENIEAQLNEAGEQQRQAEALRQQYEHRLVDWEDEREQARQALHGELESEHARLLERLQSSLDEEREKARVLAERVEHERLHALEGQALEQGARFVSHLLERIASPVLEGELFKLMMEELRALPDSQREALQSVENGAALETLIVSAYPLESAQQAMLEQQLNALVNIPLNFRYEQNPSLIAGLRVTVGPWVMHVNLHDELKAFAAVAYEQ